jgi:hypothetical protein
MYDMQLPAGAHAEGHGDHPTARGATVQLAEIRKQKPFRVLSEADWQHWITRGYVIVRNAAPQAQCAAVVDMLWEFEEMDRHDPSTWYRPQRRENKMRELNNAGLVEVYNHQSLWTTRQNRRIYDAFVDIWDREDLWVAIDRANLNPPNRGARAAQRENGFIHFDVDITARPRPIGVQGVLSLAPQDPEVGGFQCVPGIFANLDDFVAALPPGSNQFKPDITGHEIVNTTMNTGDLLIFNSLLAHGVRPNRSENRVRIAQYISMFPADFDNKPLRQARIRTWTEQTAPVGDPFPGDPRGFERSHYPVATLDHLGEKLLGLTRWK